MENKEINLSKYISQLRENPDTKGIILPLVEHIAYLEAELRTAKTEITDLKYRMEYSLEKEDALKSDKPEKLTVARSNLYRAVGELAFVIAKSDNILRDSERQAFYQVIRKNFGVNSWVAEDRFNLIEKTPTTDVESSYNQVIFNIKRNREGLTPNLVKRFIMVIGEVAEVAGVHEKQAEYINRFKEDLLKILEA